jgi:hypothetical protein
MTGAIRRCPHRRDWHDEPPFVRPASNFWTKSPERGRLVVERGVGLPPKATLPSKTCKQRQRTFRSKRKGVGEVAVRYCSPRCHHRAKDDRQLVPESNRLAATARWASIPFLTDGAPSTLDRYMATKLRLLQRPRPHDHNCDLPSAKPLPAREAKSGKRYAARHGVAPALRIRGNAPEHRCNANSDKACADEVPKHPCSERQIFRRIRFRPRTATPQSMIFPRTLPTWIR